MEKFRKQKMETEKDAKGPKDPSISDAYDGVSEEILSEVFGKAQEEGTHYKEPNNNYKSSL